MVELSKDQVKKIIAKNIAAILEPNSYVNLGVGIPTEVAYYITPEQNIILHAENGLLGTAGDVKSGEIAEEGVISSSGFYTTYIPGASFFDSSLSFGIIRGGHLSATVLGAMQVAENGDIANYTIPGKVVVGMGGAMDLCVGAREVIVASTHTNKGKPKILKNCTIPLTAVKSVTKIVTEKAIFSIEDEKLVLIAYNPLFTVEEIISEVEPDVYVSDTLYKMITD